MKTLRYAVIFMTFVTCFTAKGQDRIVERDGQVIILQEGTKTDRSIIGRYIITFHTKMALPSTVIYLIPMTIYIYRWIAKADSVDLRLGGRMSHFTDLVES